MGVRRGSYGVDAPLVPIVFAAVTLVATISLVLSAVNGGTGWALAGPAIPAVVFAASLALFLHSSLRGKFDVWDGLLDDLELSGDARIADLGCGRGAVLLSAAQHLDADGQASGVDLWRTVDQSGNAEEVTRANASAEGVADRVELHTADLRTLPFEDARFDVVLSSLAIHNIKAEDRERAALEALRVLRPGGSLVVVDLRAGGRYRGVLEERLDDAVIRGAGWRMWWGGPWYPSFVLTGSKPAA